jgi:hypothetical protein
MCRNLLRADGVHAPDTGGREKWKSIATGTPGQAGCPAPRQRDLLAFAVSIAAQTEDRKVDCVGHLPALQ